ncbi:MAG: phosphoserine phosphatase [Gammaproteobacteria bacterium RIFOXYA12_FULL_61_12]|nr:MAG: phosphoserine phosphatase [Gammaproteobacteria bacterium RIFOXYD12_FULL_61_37]OGT92769.1 MAG: phosphoserine phosphatase [Gammaproteobacteria bacterium RIFOXYA12_FULL_61_12]
MPLAIFDLDNTLLNGDSDYLWGRYLVERGIVDGERYDRENDRFYREYEAGKLDIFEFLAFALKPLADNSPEDLGRWREEFLHEKIAPIILPAGRNLIEKHRSAGDTLMIITATNAFVTAPIAERLGIPHLLATDPEMNGGHYTGRVAGTPCFQNGKVERLQQWLAAHGADLKGSFFYSDSRNDIPLLEQVEHPHAVDPDEALTAHAQERGWPIISLRK